MIDSIPGRDRRTRLGRFLPPLALMGLIWLLSAQPSLSSGLGTADLVLRKLAHMTEYGLLWLLWHRALGWRAGRWALAPAAIALAWAVIDEWHQSWVPGRNGTPVDVAIDAAGVAVAYLLWRRLRASRARSR